VLLKGDCRQQLATLPDNSIHAIITDPPYELGFMGKSWDSSGIAYNTEVWTQCLRVLKPGGHLLAFGGSRTYHRLACAIEDAGFEIRDQIMWVYGSGFPKSLDVSKAIDKMDAAQEQQARRYRFTAWVRSTGLTAEQIDQATDTNMGGHYTTDASQPRIMTTEHLDAVRHLIDTVPEWVEQEARIRSIESKNFAAREIVGVQKNAMSGWNMDGTTNFVDRNITAPITDAAKQWDGWGTALKPAHEPIVLARKPLDGTVANNVLTHGVGALNIDATRVGNETVTTTNGKGFAGSFEGGINNNGGTQHVGRWPANFIHDGSDEVLELFPEAKGGAYPAKRGQAVATSFASGQETEGGYRAMGDSGSAARFFYCAKASRTERNTGLDGLPADKPVFGDHGGTYQGLSNSKLPQANFHPTVKPLALIHYLIKLVTPPGGTILDPFLGSGTTAVAATQLGHPWIGCELTPDYWPIIEARVNHTQPLT
jgi:hypothetical protein